MAKLEPGRDAEMAGRTRTLNVVFALTSIGLLIVFSLMIWYDFGTSVSLAKLTSLLSNIFFTHPFTNSSSGAEITKETFDERKRI